MGRIRDLLKALATNENVESQEDYEEVQEELRNLLQANGESENRIAALEKGLDTAKKRAELQEELKAPANAKEAVEKAKRKINQAKDKEEQERE